ncbi:MULTISPECIES: hypothetical protein [unclassified Brevibacterium]|nr:MULTISPECIES: hypothetical protein [unclassified Brevibacterium]
MISLDREALVGWTTKIGPDLTPKSGMSWINAAEVPQTVSPLRYLE